jgi:hypothetical protein
LLGGQFHPKATLQVRARAGDVSQDLGQPLGAESDQRLGGDLLRLA